MVSRISEAFWGLADPWIFMSLSARWFPSTVLSLVQGRQWGPLLHPRKLQDAWFGMFWSWAGPQVKEGASAKVIPLLEGRTNSGKILDLAQGPGIEGTCIEIGAGSGFWVDIFSNRHIAPTNGDGANTKKSMRKEVTRVYGVEPNLSQHAKLREHVEKAGLEDVYQIVPVGIESLGDSKKWDGKFEKESVDCIVSILCLCSIPEPQKNIRELYGYLKKGGRWYVYEHVQCSNTWYMKLYQRFVNLFWPQFLGGCQLCRPTQEYLVKAGDWTSIDLGQPVDEQWHHCVPHILGTLTK